MRLNAWRAAHSRSGGVQGNIGMLFRAIARNGQVQKWDQLGSLLDAAGGHEAAAPAVAGTFPAAAASSCGGATAGVLQQEASSGAGAACNQGGKTKQGAVKSPSWGSGLWEYGLLRRQLQGGWDALRPAQERPLAVSGCHVPVCRTWQRLDPNGSSDPWVISSTCQFRPFVEVAACGAAAGAWYEGCCGDTSLVAESLSPFVFSEGVSTGVGELGSRRMPEPACGLVSTLSVQTR